MATLLTSVETPFPGECCALPAADPGAEVLSCVVLTVRGPGISGTAIKKKRLEKGYPERRRRSRGLPRRERTQRATLPIPATFRHRPILSLT
jgi:hypothetical protein